MTLIDTLPENLIIHGDWEQLRVWIDGTELLPTDSLTIRNHSQDFSWGYAGSGPSQLSLAILLLYLPLEAAKVLYQTFKHGVVSKWPQADFSVVLNVRGVIEKISRDNEFIIERLKELIYGRDGKRGEGYWQT